MCTGVFKRDKDWCIHCYCFGMF